MYRIACCDLLPSPRFGESGRGERGCGSIKLSILNQKLIADAIPHFSGLVAVLRPVYFKEQFQLQVTEVGSVGPNRIFAGHSAI